MGTRRWGYALASLAVVAASIAVFDVDRNPQAATFRGMSWVDGHEGRITDAVSSGDEMVHRVERTRGVVREFHGEEGWGVLDAPAMPGGCWVFYSEIEGTGFRMLYAGQEVEIEYEDLVAMYGPGAMQGGFRYRATSVKP